MSHRARGDGSSNRWQRRAWGSPLGSGTCETKMSSCHKISLRGKWLSPRRAAPLCTDMQEPWKVSSSSSMSLEPNKSCYLFQGGLLEGAAADQRTSNQSQQLRCHRDLPRVDRRMQLCLWKGPPRIINLTSFLVYSCDPPLLGTQVRHRLHPQSGPELTHKMAGTSPNYQYQLETCLAMSKRNPNE